MFTIAIISIIIALIAMKIYMSTGKSTKYYDATLLSNLTMYSLLSRSYRSDAWLDAQSSSSSSSSDSSFSDFGGDGFSSGGGASDGW